MSMPKNIYVGNLPYSTTSEELREIFEQYGEVVSAVVITDRFTGRSRGFGFVEMANNQEAEKAIQELNGSTLGGRSIVVNETRAREERGGGGGGRSGGRRDRGGSGGYRGYR
jgi:RNA recognition motif-containing protein